MPFRISSTPSEASLERSASFALNPSPPKCASPRSTPKAIAHDRRIVIGITKHGRLHSGLSSTFTETSFGALGASSRSICVNSSVCCSFDMMMEKGFDHLSSLPYLLSALFFCAGLSPRTRAPRLGPAFPFPSCHLGTCVSRVPRIILAFHLERGNQGKGGGISKISKISKMSSWLLCRAKESQAGCSSS